jgi:hypothetical protein
MENEQEQAETTGSHQGEIDGMKLENEQLKHELEIRGGKILSLEKTLAEKTGELSLNLKSLEEAKQVIVETTVDLAQAIGAYKIMAGQANPGLVADMIKGNTVAEINNSIKNAKEMVEKVRQEITAEAARVRIPAGAPPRAMSDLSALSAREKIKLAVEGR